MSGNGLDVVPKFSGVSGEGIDVVPNYSKSPVPVIPAVYTGFMARYVPYRAQPSLRFGYQVNLIIIWVKILLVLFLSEVGSINEWILP